MGWTATGWFWIWPLLVLIGLLLLGYVGFRISQNRGPGSGTGPTADSSAARRILDERYARGEIDDEEYRRRRAELQ